MRFEFSIRRDTINAIGTMWVWALGTDQSRHTRTTYHTKHRKQKRNALRNWQQTIISSSPVNKNNNDYNNSGTCVRDSFVVNQKTEK